MPKPPKAAIWLLDHLGVSRSNSPLYGDLIEEFHAGRSCFWFWKQSVVAIARNGRFLPGFVFATFIGWVIQLVPAFLIWRVTQHLDLTVRIAAVVLGLGLFVLQQRGRRLLAGSTKWREVQCLLRRADGPFNFRGVPLWTIIAVDECVDYLVTCVWLVASVGPFTLGQLIFCEILWLFAHAFVQSRILRRHRV